MIIVRKYFEINKLRKDIAVLLSIVFLPFLFFIYKIVPEKKIWTTELFIIESGVFDDVQYFIWFISVKLLTLALLLIWYFTCTNKWKSIILFPIIIESYKLYSIVNVWSKGYVLKHSTKEILIILICAIVFVLIMLLRSENLKNPRTVNEKMNDQINNYLKKITKFDVNYYQSIKNEFIDIKKENKNLEKREYLLRLVELRDKLI